MAANLVKYSYSTIETTTGIFMPAIFVKIVQHIFYKYAPIYVAI